MLLEKSIKVISSGYPNNSSYLLGIPHYTLITLTMFYYRTPTLFKKPANRQKIEVDAIEMEILCQLKEIATPSCSTETDDEDVAYSKAIALTIKRLGPQQKAQTKIRIQQLLYDIEFPTESVPSHPSQESPYTYTHAHGYNCDTYYNF